VHTGGLKDGGTYDRFIIRFLKGAPEDSNSSARMSALTAAGRAHGVGIGQSRRLAVGADVFKTDRKLDRVAAEAFMRRLASNARVDYVEIDKLNKPIFTPNDTNYSQQWGYQDSDAGIRANEAWDLTTGVGSVVAVLDTGITNHSDLNANVLPGYDFIIDTDVSVDGNGRDSDPSDPGDWYNNAHCGPLPAPPSSNSSWHGTHVAGTIAAVTNNAKGVAGTAHGAKIVPVRVLGRCGGYDSDIADAMVWASGGTVSGVPANANPAEVINLSLGGDGACGATTQAAIDGGVGRGTTFVIAAGNDNEDVSGHSPGNCANVVSVASVTSTGARSSFSNYGTLIDIAAPGSTIMSTLNAGTTTPGAESYANYSGTSMATPHVAGVVALMQAYATTPKTPAQIESLLKSTARPFPVTPSQTIGPGIADAKAAVDAVNGTSNTVLTNGVAKTGLGASTGASLNYTMVVPSGATGLKFVTSGGTGDADMYVKFGSAPTDTVYDCRPYVGGNAETCNITTAQAGTYYVRLKAYTTFSGVSLTGSYTTGTPVQTYTNSADYTINDNATVDSPITVSGRSGNAPSNASVSVNIVHTYQGDLKVDLVAPDGSLYNIHNYTGTSTDNVIKTVTFNLSTEALNGTWKLRVNDNAAGDVGYINSWSITF
jgi:serine protease